ncbi:hypothetical protein [Endozoicomonas sp. 8E]|uniref:LPS-assembly lipoprotein LptE n=1 Tax=Endozoicomonas sp. 8E TaxID=3035692 RepID=UPI002939258A|nr:hypothetical protein [Endozoicomonas sp. 8E]WOG26647.1 hypothetical protein P6910_19160 [Endozoicomonas sp. 8E]
MTRRFHTGAILPLLLITSLLTACGFQLRGKVDIASEIAQLSVSGSDLPFVRELKKALTLNGIEITDNAHYHLQVVSLERSTGDEIQASVGQYERLLILKATYQLSTHDGLKLFDPIVLFNERYMFQDKNQTNAALSEEAIIFDQLRQELLLTTVRRVAGISEEVLRQEEVRARKALEAEREAREVEE